MVEGFYEFERGIQYKETHQHIQEHAVHKYMPPGIVVYENIACENGVIDLSQSDVHPRVLTVEKSDERQKCTEKPVQHKKCWKDFVYSESFLTHEKPSREKPYGNEQFNDPCGSLTSYQGYETTHNGDNLREYKQLETALMTCSYVQSYERIQSGDKPFVCKQCGCVAEQSYLHQAKEQKRCRKEHGSP